MTVIIKATSAECLRASPQKDTGHNTHVGTGCRSQTDVRTSWQELHASYLQYTVSSGHCSNHFINENIEDQKGQAAYFSAELAKDQIWTRYQN